MPKILRGFAVATVLSLSPLAAVAAPTAANAAPAAATSEVRAAAPASTAAKAKPRRQISVRDLPGPQAKLRIKVRPEFGGKRLIVQTRKNGKFRTTGRLKTNRQGVVVKVFEGSRRGIRYRLIAPAGNKYAASGVSFTITRRVY